MLCNISVTYSDQEQVEVLSNSGTIGNGYFCHLLTTMDLLTYDQ